MRTFCVEVEHPHRGKLVRTSRTVEARNFDHAVQKALNGFNRAARPMSVLFEVPDQTEDRDLFSEAE